MNCCSQGFLDEEGVMVRAVPAIGWSVRYIASAVRSKEMNAGAHRFSPFPSESHFFLLGYMTVLKTRIIPSSTT